MEAALNGDGLQDHGGDDDDDSEDNIPLDRLMNGGAKHEEHVQYGKKEELLLEMDKKEDIIVSTSVSRLSKSKRVKKEKKKPMRIVQSESDDDDDYVDADADDNDADDDDDDDDIPIAARTHKQQKKAPKPRSKRSTTTTSSTSKRRAPRGTKRRTRGKSEAKPIAKRQRTAKEEDVSARRFEKAGQRKETPAENDPSRLFYESMYNEKLALGKRSTLAEQWMLRHGLLDDDVAQEVLRRLAAGKMAR